MSIVRIGNKRHWRTERVFGEQKAQDSSENPSNKARGEGKRGKGNRAADHKGKQPLSREFMADNLRRKGANYAEYFTATSIAKGGRGKGEGGIGPPTTKANSRFQRNCGNQAQNAHKNSQVVRFAQKRVKRVLNAYQTNVG